MKREAKMILILSDARGRYIPRDFANEIRRDHVTGVSDADWAILEDGPDNEAYWDAWSDVCDSAVVTDDDGTVYTVYQDGDCWLVEQGAEFNEHGAAPGIDTMFYVEEVAPGTVEYTAPSAWASYLVNADASGLEDGEIAQCDAWIKGIGLGAPVACEDAGFIAYHDARDTGALPADCQTYAFPQV